MVRNTKKMAVEAKMINEDGDGESPTSNLPSHPDYLPKDYRKRQALQSSPVLQRLDKYMKIDPRDATAPNWLCRHEIPSANEIMDIDEEWEQNHNATGSVLMEGIKAKGAVEGRNDGDISAKFVYLETHYQLLREDAVRPLRLAATTIRDMATLPVEQLGSVFQNIGIYSKVHVRGLTFSRRGIAVEVSFSMRSCRSRVAWENSNRLTSGTLVVLSKDKFKKNCIVATIAARNLEKLNLNPPRIDLYFADMNALELDPCEEFMMVEERSGFFEAQRSSMLALQRLAKENGEEEFPMSKKIIHVEEEEGPPAYVAENPVIDARKVFGPEFEKYNVLDMPNPVGSTMDETQLSAVHHMLNSRLAVIQGPPGTGKTFVSVLALKLLLNLTANDHAPIVVACHTNHALDQLLRHIAQDIPEGFARLGARSKDDGIVKQRTMKALRQDLDRTEKDPCNRGYKLRRKLEQVVKTLTEKLELYTSGTVTLADLSKAGVLRPEQCQSIINGNSQYSGESRRAGHRRRMASRVTSKGEGNEMDPLHSWLGTELENTPSLDLDDTLGVDYTDDEDQWELEVVKERMAEAGIGDDDLDQVYGEYVALKMNIKGKGRLIMSQAEGDKILSSNNINDNVSPRKRGAFLNHLLGKMKEKALSAFRSSAKVIYSDLPREFQQLSFERDLVILQRQKLIGMTTTGLSKFRPVLDALSPKVIMIEEAAESLEAPLVAACVPSLQHLILVGDHQQLKPTVVVKEHAGQPWNFDLSLMERLLNNELAYQHLGVQRRMAPEISANLFPIYGDNLRDHDNVKDREPVEGMLDTTWAYSHQHFDQKDPFMSSYNIGEADMIAGFYLYLLQNGMDRSRITVLTFYKAQRKLLLEKLQKICVSQRLTTERPITFRPEDHLPDVRTVDSYQGEENDVIVISLVRSSGSSGIGFAGSDNRICVAISRARLGFYVFGNLSLFASCSPTWSHIEQIMSANGKVGEEEMRIQCKNHDHVSIIQTAQDWDEINGGCVQLCGAILACGHKCPARCHPNGHEDVVCQPCFGPPAMRDPSIEDKPMETSKPEGFSTVEQVAWGTTLRDSLINAVETDVNAKGVSKLQQKKGQRKPAYISASNSSRQRLLKEDVSVIQAAGVIWGKTTNQSSGWGFSKAATPPDDSGW